MTVDSIVDVFADVRFNYQNESDLQNGIARVFTSKNIPYKREARIGAGERVDFLIERIAVEVKIKGSASAIFRQLMRYTQCHDIQGIVLVHADLRFCLDPTMLHTIAGQPLPVRIAHLQGAWF